MSTIKLKIFFITIVYCNLLCFNSAKAFNEQNNSFKNLTDEINQKQIDDFEQWKLKQEINKKEEKGELKQNKGNCFFIEKIDFKGNKIIKTKNLQKIVKNYINTEICTSEIKNILSLVSNFYIKKGYITSQVFVKEQNLTQQKLLLTIVEGKIESISFGDNELKDRISLFFLSPIKKNQTLNIKDIDQTTENLQSLTNYNYKTQVEAGSSFGLSKININGTKSFPLKFDLELDNKGQEQTGSLQSALKINSNNIIGLGEILTIKGSSGLNPKKKNAYSRYITYSYSQPFNYFKFMYNGSYSTYNKFTEGSNAVFSLNGNSTSHSFNLNYVLLRGTGYKLTPFITFNFSENNSYINDAIIQVQSRKIANLELGFQYNLYSKYGAFFTRLSLIKGIKAFNSLYDKPNLEKNLPHAEFNLYKLYLYYSKNLTQKLNYNGIFDLQYSNTALFSENQFTAGGSSTVRGFKDYGISGSSGFYMQNNLEYNFNKYFNFGIFFDFAKTLPPHFDFKQKSLFSTGLSIAFSTKYNELKITFANTIYPISNSKTIDIVYKIKTY